MKTNIHPDWNSEAKVSCVCGNTFTTGSTQGEIKVDICSKCHPLYTGTQKLVDTLGQVERFENKTKKAAAQGEVRQRIIANRASKAQKGSTERASLKDLLMQARKNLNS